MLYMIGVMLTRFDTTTSRLEAASVSAWLLACTAVAPSTGAAELESIVVTLEDGRYKVVAEMLVNWMGRITNPMTAISTSPARKANHRYWRIRHCWRFNASGKMRKKKAHFRFISDAF